MRNQSSPPSPALVAGGLAVGVVAVSSAAILIRVAAAPAVAVAFWRCLGGGAVLAPFAARARRGRSPLEAGQWAQLAGSGLLLAVHFALWIGSLSLTTVASSVTLTNMTPLFAGLGSAILLGEPPSRRVWAGVALTVPGAGLVAVGDATGPALGGRALLGDAMALGGAAAMAGYLLVGRSARRRLPTSVYAGAVYGVAAGVLLVAAWATGSALAGYGLATWLALAGLVAGPQMLGHTVFNAVLSAVTATVVAVVAVAEPVGSTLLAWLLLDELPTPLFWAGAPLILAGILVATAPRPRRPATGADRAAAPGGGGAD